MFCRMMTATVLLGWAILADPAPAAPSNGVRVKFSQDHPVTVAVSGTVRDKRTDRPIAGALVRAHIVLWTYQPAEWLERCPCQEAVSDARGEYRLTFVAPLTTSGPMAGKDNLCVYASSPGYETLPRYGHPYVTARNCTFINLDFALDAGRRLRGVVQDPAGQPVDGAVVRVQNNDNGDWNSFGSLGRAVTGKDGSFELWFGGEASRNSKPWLSAVKQGVGTRIVFDLQAKEDLGVLRLHSGGALAGKVVGTAGKPVPNCEVSVRCRPFDLVCKALTDAGGDYMLTGVSGDATMQEFSRARGRTYRPDLAEVEVYARPAPDLKLKDAPRYKIGVQEGKTLTGPALVVGAALSVSGRLLPSKTALSLGGLVVRLDEKWDDIAQADMEGDFRFPNVPAGKHRLTAYLPHNLRYDRGIGKTEIEVQAGAPLADVQIQLADLAELRVQYLDAAGNPLADVTAGATWSKNGEGAWTEGTVSDGEGWAVLYLYPDAAQYVRGFDPSGKLAAETVREVKPGPGQVLEPVQIVMVPMGSLSGRLVDGQGQLLAEKPVLGTLTLADNTTVSRGLKTDALGRFSLEGITPGVMRISFEVNGVAFADAFGRAIEVRPGQKEELGDVVLKGGVDKKQVAREKRAQALEQPQEITQAAQDLFNRIRGADYDYFLKEPAEWQRFPIFGHYQTYKWYDELVKWMSMTFKTNPIANVELGQVFANAGQLSGHKGLPVVPYKVTLANGTVLEGNLPFEYSFDGAKGHWYGVEGIDWHLQKEPPAEGTPNR